MRSDKSDGADDQSGGFEQHVAERTQCEHKRQQPAVTTPGFQSGRGGEQCYTRPLPDRGQGERP
jgi:hypothetical protein